MTLGGTVEAGDVYTVTVNQASVSYRVEAGDVSMSDVQAGLVKAINATPEIAGVVTASAGISSGEISLRANEAGTRDSFQVNTTLSGSQYEPSTTMLKDGGFVVTWNSDSDIYAQRYDGEGTLVGDEFRVNSYTSGTQQTPSIASLDDGGFIVTWSDSSGHDGGSSYDIRGRRYDLNGEALADEFLVNQSMVSGNQYTPSVSGLKNGGFVVSWRDDSGSSHDAGDGAGAGES